MSKPAHSRFSPASSAILLALTSLAALTACAAWAGGQAAIAQSPAADSTFFETKIRPLLAEKCFACHGDQAQRGGLRLNTEEGLGKGATTGAVVVAGKPEASSLIRAVHYEGAVKMPPGGKLSETEIANLTEWVRQGAVWGSGGEKGRQGEKSSSLLPSSALSSAFPYPAERRKFWSFQPVKNPPLPSVKDSTWCKNPIDRFILAGLEAKGLKPAPAADRRTLIRRATFDLAGLPPTPNEVEAFVNDKSPAAWAKVVDRLLASPRYGERWGRHWLDVVRYADSLDARGVGGEGDISEAWRYRDWIVNAFNQDMPYNWFMKYQVAGDVLTANPDGTIATGLLAIGNWGNGDADKDKILTDIADDQVDVVSRSMMGLTVACARCHDHKFDPIPTKDYYGLAGIFFSSHILPKLTPKGAGELLLRVSLDTPEDKAKREQHAQNVAAFETRLAQERNARLGVYAKRLLPQTARYVEAVWQYANRPDAQANVSLDDWAKTQNLQAWALRQWRDLMGLGEYPRMLQPNANVMGNPNVNGWRGVADCPNALVNRGDTPQVISTLTLPPHSTCVHPGPANGVVVAWRSPFTGTVRITGRVADADPNGGNGIAWALDHRSALGSRELATGEFANGGAQDFAQGQNTARLQAVAVRQGECVELAVLPKGEYSFDTTLVELTISEAGEASGKPRIWNLTHDVSMDTLQGGKGNPHADSYGNAGVWSFEDMADRQRSAVFGNGETLQLTQLRQAFAAQSAKAASENGVPVGLRQAIETFARSFTLSDAKSPFWIHNLADGGALPPEDRKELAALETQLDTLRKNPPPAVRFANAAQEGGVPESPHAGVHDVRVHIRGNYARLGDLAPRHFPVVLAGDKQPAITQGSGRRELAEWLASDTHPLTPRVWVNRVWQHHFGQGIVRTPSNFGFLGEKPTHPLLLDWLAFNFVAEEAKESRINHGEHGGHGENTEEKQRSRQADKTIVPQIANRKSQIVNPYACGWSTKKLHRLILLSATYQQASEGRVETVKADPDNRLWGRMTRQRLEAEEVRDNLLAASGKLDTTMGGVAYRDFAIPRRTLYYMTIRSDRSGFGPLFDAADSTNSVDRRTVSTVAPQSLYLLNNPFVLEQTRALARRLQQEVPDGADSDAARIRRAYLVLYGRPAAEAELAVGLSYLRHARTTRKDASANKDKAGQEDAAWEAYCQILLCANEFVYID